MQKASAKKQQRHKLNKPSKPKTKPSKPKTKPSKPKTKPSKQSWRKKVDWSAAGRKAYETRMKNQKKNKKAVNLKNARGNAEAPQQRIRK